MAGVLGADIFYILNKADSRSRAVMETHIEAEKIAATIPPSDALFASSLEGKPLVTEIPEITPVGEMIINRLSRSR